MAWNHVFLEYGEDGVPTWDISSFTYYRVPCRFCSPAESAGPSGKLFWYVKKIEWCSNVRLLGRSKGSTHTYFFLHTRQLSHSRVSSYSTVWQSAFWETMTVRSQVVFGFKMTLILEFPKRHGFFWEGTGTVDNAPARRKGALGKHHETQISPQWSLCNFLDFPSHFWHEVW